MVHHSGLMPELQMVSYLNNPIVGEYQPCNGPGVLHIDRGNKALLVNDANVIFKVTEN